MDYRSSVICFYKAKGMKTVYQGILVPVHLIGMILKNGELYNVFQSSSICSFILCESSQRAQRDLFSEWSNLVELELKTVIATGATKE